MRWLNKSVTQYTFECTGLRFQENILYHTCSHSPTLKVKGWCVMVRRRSGSVTLLGVGSGNCLKARKVLMVHVHALWILIWYILYVDHSKLALLFSITEESQYKNYQYWLRSGIKSVLWKDPVSFEGWEKGDEAWHFMEAKKAIAPCPLVKVVCV